jgi:hypothetical protein
MQMNEIDPQILEELLSSGTAIGGKQDLIAQQKAMADRLRARGGSPALMQAGGTQVAASPFAHIAAAGNNIMANRADQAGAAAQGDVRTMQGQQNSSTMAAIRKALMKMGGAPATPAPVGAPPATDGQYVDSMYLGQ